MTIEVNENGWKSLTPLVADHFGTGTIEAALKHVLGTPIQEFCQGLLHFLEFMLQNSHLTLCVCSVNARFDDVGCVLDVVFMLFLSKWAEKLLISSISEASPDLEGCTIAVAETHTGLDVLPSVRELLLVKCSLIFCFACILSIVCHFIAYALLSSSLYVATSLDL